MEYEKNSFEFLNKVHALKQFANFISAETTPYPVRWSLWEEDFKKTRTVYIPKSLIESSLTELNKTSEQVTYSGIRYIHIGENAVNLQLQSYGINKELTASKHINLLTYSTNSSNSGDGILINNYYDCHILNNLDIASKHSVRVVCGNNGTRSSLFTASPELLLVLNMTSLVSNRAKTNPENIVKLMYFRWIDKAKLASILLMPDFNLDMNKKEITDTAKCLADASRDKNLSFILASYLSAEKQIRQRTKPRAISVQRYI